jgi:four helix bundle protein
LAGSSLATQVALGLLPMAPMGVHKLEDLLAYRAAREFKLAVYQIAQKSSGVRSDDRYRHQLFDAAASVEINIAEGFRRFSPAEFCQFLRYSRASLEETQRWLDDGVARGYFAADEIRDVHGLAETAAKITMGLWRSLQPFVKKGR